MSTGFRMALVGSTIACALLSGIASSSQSSDAWLTTKVKVALLAADGVDGLAIDVDTSDGRVTLHGMVGSEAEKTRAERAAQNVVEVRGVRNALAVVSEEEQAVVSRRDEKLRRTIASAIERSSELETSAIAIASVHDGIVVLAGRARSSGVHHFAVDLVREIDGVRRVVSEIHSPDVLEDIEIWDQTAAASSRSDSQMYAALSDSWITAKAKFKLLTSCGYSPLRVRVDTRGGVVTVLGIVETEGEKRAAADALMDVVGVRSVVNGLSVAVDVAAG